MDAQFSGNAPRRAGETEQKGGQNPVWQRPLALVEQGIGEVVEGALAAVTPVAFAAGSIVVLAPRVDVWAVTSGTLEWTIFPPECVNICLALFGVEELVQVRE